MGLVERTANLHIHTYSSDGSGDLDELVAAAREAGLDVLIVTDHNASPAEGQGWQEGVLVLLGEEVHNPAQSQINHYLVFGAGEGMAPHGGSPQRLVQAVAERGGLGFVAHPFEHSGAYAREPEINWKAWDVEGYTGLEIWNYMSEFKSHLSNLAVSLLFAYWPKLAISGPYPETLARWDALLAERRMVGIAGSDVHGTVYRVGPLRRRVFPYAHCFRALNTHLLLSGDWHGAVSHDAALVYEALALGRAFIGYDALARTDGFSFVAEHGGAQYTMGDEVTADGSARFIVRTPAPGRIRLLANGRCLAERTGIELTQASDPPGAYRVEVHRRYMGKPRGWIYSNPIYLRAARPAAPPKKGRA